MVQKSVGNAIKEARTRLGLTQAELAGLVCLARVSIVSIEKGHFQPTIETALRLSRALGEPVEQLFWLQEKR
jgi:putative transcriptional regulator